MKHIFKLFTIALLAFSLGLGFNNFAKSDMLNTYKIAVVDTNMIIEKSTEIQNLKIEQQAKVKELEKWLETVKADLDKQPTEEAKQTLLKQYDNEFIKKQENIKKNYETKLKQIDNNVSGIIEQQAKDLGYNLVLTKNAVLFGGNDITEQVLAKIK